MSIVLDELTFFEVIGFTLWLWLLVFSACCGALALAAKTFQHVYRQGTENGAGERDELVH
jgi:UPF0716 family protein affecting phage T7 exclusion